MKYPPQGGAPSAVRPGGRSRLRRENLAGQDGRSRVKELSALLDKWYVPAGRTSGRQGFCCRREAQARAQAPRNKKRAAAATPAKSAPAKPTSRPNILLLYADDQRNHTLGCAGIRSSRPQHRPPGQTRVRFEERLCVHVHLLGGPCQLFTGATNANISTGRARAAESEPVRILLLCGS